MTQEKLFKFIKSEYFKLPPSLEQINKKAEMAGFTIDFTAYESSVIKKLCTIILNNFELKPKNSSH